MYSDFYCTECDTFSLKCIKIAGVRVSSAEPAEAIRSDLGPKTAPQTPLTVIGERWKRGERREIDG